MNPSFVLIITKVLLDLSTKVGENNSACFFKPGYIGAANQ